jgi:hypothetical protein
MKAGDPGRLMYMWKRWAVMGQGMPKLPHYSKHLPKLILMLEEVLPVNPNVRRGTPSVNGHIVLGGLTGVF